MTKRELVDTGGDKRFVRRDSKGRFDDVTDVGQSLAADQRSHFCHEPPKGDRKKTH